MAFPMSNMSHLVPVSTQSEEPSTLALSSLDMIAITPQAVSRLNNKEHNAAFFQSVHGEYKPYVMWHPTAGLIVSPNVSYLPREVPDSLDGPRNSGKHTSPKLIADDEIYLAFRPRYIQNTGDLFGRLSLNRAALSKLICPLVNGGFILSIAVIERWSRLEDALLDVSTILLAAARSIPKLDSPKFPYEFGYRDPHKARDAALRCAVRSRDAFIELSALVSFAISLHMDSEGGLNAAFDIVKRRSTYKPVPAWFDLLSNSYVCNFGPNFRVGAFLNPYTSKWLNHIAKFVQANVPIWIHWGHFHRITPPQDAAAYQYSPGEHRIEAAQARAQVTSTLILPVYRYDPFFMNRGRPQPSAGAAGDDDPMGTMDPMSASQGELPPSSMWESAPLSPIRDSLLSPLPRAEPPAPAPLLDSEVEAARQGKALAALEDHFERMARAREVRLSIELPLEKQRREAWEQHAVTYGRYTNKSPVYEWRALPDGTYERVKLETRELAYAWSNFTQNQKKYVGHLNTWELCPQFPAYSDAHPKENEPWDEDSDYYSDDEIMDDTPLVPDSAPAPTTSSLQPSRSGSELLYLDDLRDLAPPIPDVQLAGAPLTNAHVETFDFANFVSERFGYDIFSPAAWSNMIQPSDKTKNITLRHARMALSFNETPGGPVVENAVINLIRMLSNPTWTFRDLPFAFDYSNARRVSLESDTLQIFPVLCDNITKYLVCKKGYVDKCPWGIFVTEPSTVLLMFRHRWQTVHVIARELVARGVPFHTVVAADAPPVTARRAPVRGLGERPRQYKPTQDDYVEYLRRREELLTGPKGRAALMHGGIVARIARDVLDYDLILDGPSEDAVTVGEYKRFNLYDDALDENDVNIICGVYYVDVEAPPVGKKVSSQENFMLGTKAHMSYWPKDSAWNQLCPYLRTQWTESAERFYQTRKVKLETTPELFTASAWRQALRMQNAVTKEIEEGTEHYQAGYIEDFYRRTRFVAEHH